MSQPTIDAVLQALAAREPVDALVAVVVAHPDDETIGLGPLLRLFRRLRLIHVTDGAPRDLHDALAAGFATCEAYAAARRRELRAALVIGGCPDLDDRNHAPLVTGVVSLPVADQAASLNMAGLAAALGMKLAGASLVITHAYEGGHPDHDAVAFAVQATGFPTVEMAGYHAAPDGGIRVGQFALGIKPTVVTLTKREQDQRDAMLKCFATQQTTLAPFLGWTELRYRPALRHDFTLPLPQRAYYDGFSWGMTHARWRALAAEALAAMSPAVRAGGTSGTDPRQIGIVGC